MLTYTASAQAAWWLKFVLQKKFNYEFALATLTLNKFKNKKMHEQKYENMKNHSLRNKPVFKIRPFLALVSPQSLFN